MISNISSLPSDKQVTSSVGTAGFQARSRREEPGLPFNLAVRKAVKLDVT